MTLAGRGRSVRAYHRERPRDLRQARPWHRLAYIIDALPEAIAGLVASMQVRPKARVLDYGCADKPYEHLFPDAVFVGADLAGNPDADLVLDDLGRVPTEDGGFDVVLSTQVLEHVEDPGGYLAECYRVLRPGGHLLLTTHGVMVLHPDPIDYWRWTSQGLRFEVERAGLWVEEWRGIMGLTGTGLQLIQDAWYHRLPPRIASLFALVMQGCIRFVDRLEPDEQKQGNALVYGLIARKP